MNESMRRDGLLTVIGLGVVVAIYLIAIEVPGRRAAAQVRQEIALAEQVIREIPLRVAELTALQADVAGRTRRLDDLAAAVPADARLHGVVSAVAKLAEQSSLKVTRLEPLAASRQETYQRVPLRVTMTGEFAGIVAFLRGLERQPRVFTFEQCTFRHELGRAESPVEADVHFSVYADGAERVDSIEKNDSSARSAADTRRR